MLQRATLSHVPYASQIGGVAALTQINLQCSPRLPRSWRYATQGTRRPPL